MEPLTVGIDQAAELIGLSPWTIRNFIRNGKLAAVKIGRRTLIERKELERLVEAGRQEVKHDANG